MLWVQGGDGGGLSISVWKKEQLPSARVKVMLFVCDPIKTEDLREMIISSDCVFKKVEEEFKK